MVFIIHRQGWGMFRSLKHTKGFSWSSQASPLNSILYYSMYTSSRQHYLADHHTIIKHSINHRHANTANCRKSRTRFISRSNLDRSGPARMQQIQLPPLGGVSGRNATNLFFFSWRFPFFSSSLLPTVFIMNAINCKKLVSHKTKTKKKT